MSRIKIRRQWEINPVTRVVPKKKKHKKVNKVEERYLIIDALEELNEPKTEESSETEPSA
jgi:hypothetical protein